MKAAVEIIAACAWIAFAVLAVRFPIAVDTEVNFLICVVVGGAIWEATRYILSRLLLD